MNARTLSVACALSGLLALSAAGQSSNHPSSTLVVNRNAAGAAPLQALIGIQDPNVIDIEGEPAAPWVAVFGVYDRGTTVAGMGILNVDLSLPFSRVFGFTDAEGNAQITFPVGSLSQVSPGLEVAVQTAIADATMASGFRLSGVTQITTVETMSSPPLLNPGVGSTARARAPMMGEDAGSVTVGNLTFVVDAATLFANFTAMSELAPGDWVVVEGRVGPQGALVAEQVSLEDAEKLARVSGQVQGVGPSGLVVLGVSIYTSSTTQFCDGGVSVALTDIVPGITVEVMVPVGSEVFPNADTVLLNVNVELEPEPEPEPEEEEEIEFEIPPAPPFCS